MARMTHSFAERRVREYQPLRLHDLTVEHVDVALMLIEAGNYEQRLELAEAADEIEHRGRTGGWSPRADGDPPSCVRWAVDTVNRMISATRDQAVRP